MRQFVNTIFYVLEAMMVLFLVAMTVMVFGNAVLRYGFDTGIVFSEEVSRYLFVWVIFLGSIVAMREGSHMRVDFLLLKLPPLWRNVCAACSAVLMLIACWMLLAGSWTQARLNWAVKAQVSGLPMPLVYGAMGVAAVGLALVIVSQVKHSLIFGSKQPAGVDPHG